MNRVLEMIQLQQQLNDATNGENWEEGVTKNSKVINWKRCIYMECCEMVDSFAWKHWKNIAAEPDWSNMQIEVVDVWHFVLSLELQEYKVNMLGDHEDLASKIAQMHEYKALDAQEFFAYATPFETMEKVEDILRVVLSKEKLDIELLLKYFFELAQMCGLTLNDLYRLYVGKNILNQFRQDNGYKSGEYIKEWNGIEDNIVMKGIWEENANIKAAQLYKELERRYELLES